VPRHRQIAVDDSVDDFLKKASAASAAHRDALIAGIRDGLEDKQTIGVPPQLSEAIRGLEEGNGDEALRSICLFCAGKWADFHDKLRNLALDRGDYHSALMIEGDAGRIRAAMTILLDIGSFSGDDDWRDTVVNSIGSLIDAERQGR
jgi:hypothetical protein